MERQLLKENALGNTVTAKRMQHVDFAVIVANFSTNAAFSRPPDTFRFPAPPSVHYPSSRCIRNGRREYHLKNIVGTELTCPLHLR
jgi:hypothetical protein